MKTCAKIPNILQKNGELIEGIAETEADWIFDKQTKNAFMRGAMNFEDYNYNNINKHVLINPNELANQHIKMDDD